MIRVCADRRHERPAQLVVAALARSVGLGQVALGDLAADSARIATVVGTDAVAGDDLAEWLSGGRRKLIVFGPLPGRLAQASGARAAPPIDPSAATCSPAAAHKPAESAARIQYTTHAGRLGGRPWRRPFVRFDFADEWNNQGYGAIRADGSIWSISEWVRLPAEHELARIETDGSPPATYAALFPMGESWVLWFNRPVGPIDSFEWRLVEDFLSSFGAPALACQPVFGEIPFGHDAAITMRLDCDEDVASAKFLADAYRERGVPFSLAIHAATLSEPANGVFAREVAAHGGSILSHSLTHAPDWGGTYTNAKMEAAKSADLMEQQVGIRPRHAVSPFHQTPDFAVRALADCGYKGVIGGSIGTYPETVTARGGPVAGFGDDFVFHTQQCMLHGDCLLKTAEPMADYFSAYDRAYESRSLFGYLDHPFSARYHYGWASEEARVVAHAALLSHIGARARAPLFLSEDDALDLLRQKARIQVREGRSVMTLRSAAPAAHDICVTYAGKSHRLSKGDLVVPVHP